MTTDPSNPFESPRADLRAPPSVQAPVIDDPHSPFAPCPRCGWRAARAMAFTWWGGLLGPKLLTHVECRSCGKTYNGRTGRSNTLGIVIYQVVVVVAAVILVASAIAILRMA